jgi:hypothetical protein
MFVYSLLRNYLRLRLYQTSRSFELPALFRQRIGPRECLISKEGIVDEKEMITV